MNRRTHSTQTDLSHFKRDNATQYTLPTYVIMMHVDATVRRGCGEWGGMLMAWHDGC